MGGKFGEAESTWRGRMARFREWTSTVAEFCRREGVSVPSFYQWRKRLEPATEPRSRGVSSPAGHASSLFVPVKVSSAPMAEIEFPSGVRVRVPATSVDAIRAAILAGGDPYREVPSC